VALVTLSLVRAWGTKKANDAQHFKVFVLVGGKFLLRCFLSSL